MKKSIFIAGGGTGGHIYPGIAIAKAIQQQEALVAIHFVGTANGLETQIVPRDGFPLHLIQGGKLNFKGNFLGKVITLLKLPLGFIQSLVLLLKFRPQAVIGVGGYAAGPFCLMAQLFGFRTFLWEANAHPGMTNRLLSYFVPMSLIVFPEARQDLKSKKIIEVGMPLRSEIDSVRTEKAISKADEFKILHFGGSQGARAIGTVLSQAIQQGGDWLSHTQVLHQAGRVDFEKFKEIYLKLPDGIQKQIDCREFLYDIPNWYQWADLVVCRGGASTLAELAAYGVPAIVIPLPLADGHQEKNALSLENAKAVKVILQKDLTVESLIGAIQTLRSDPEGRKTLSVNIKKFHRAQAAERIAQILLEPTESE